MQKVVILIAVVAVIALGAIFILRQRGQSEKLTVFVDEGTVSYKAAAEDYITSDKDEFYIPNGSSVKTSEDGAAHVVLPDDSMISLSSSTEMKITYDPLKTTILQTLGNAWFRVQKLAGRQEFSVETPDSVAAVRGTIFGVERPKNGDDEVIYVTESLANIVWPVLVILIGFMKLTKGKCTCCAK